MDLQLASVPKLEPGKFVAWDDAITAYLRFNGWYKIVKGTTKRPDEPTSTMAEVVQIVCDAQSVWDNNNEPTAGAISPTRTPAKYAAVNMHLVSGITLYTTIPVCHVVASLRHATTHTVTSLCWAWHMVRCSPCSQCMLACTTMQCIVEHHPSTNTIVQLDDEFTCMGVICVLCSKASCKVLVLRLLHSDDKLTRMEKLEPSPQKEDVSCNTMPEL